MGSWAALDAAGADARSLLDAGPPWHEGLRRQPLHLVEAAPDGEEKCRNGPPSGLLAAAGDDDCGNLIDAGLGPDSHFDRRVHREGFRRHKFNSGAPERLDFKLPASAGSEAWRLDTARAHFKFNRRSHEEPASISKLALVHDLAMPSSLQVRQAGGDLT
mgnify:CR=1 FL=1